MSTPSKQNSLDVLDTPEMILEGSSVQILEFIRCLSLEERQVMKSMLSNQIVNYFDKNNSLVLDEELTLERFHLFAEMLRMITPHSDTIPTNGIAYCGCPAWVTENLLISLQEEAYRRREQPLDRLDHFLGCGGPTADALSVSPEVLEFVAKYVGSVSPTGIASYLYYDHPGLGIRPHVDTEVFSVNLMLMLRHEFDADLEPSATVVFPAYCKPEHYHLQVGEAMIMYGSSVIHTRSIVQHGEDIHLLTIGFNRIFPGD